MHLPRVLSVGCLVLAFFAAPLAGETQQAAKVYRIGVLSPGGTPPAADSDAFWAPLRALG
jgi:hypothetical protein